MYNTYILIHIIISNIYVQTNTCQCTNLDHYIQNIHMHIITCSTCKYTMIHINAD